MAYFQYLPSNCLHFVSTYLGYNEVYQGIKYTNKALKQEICSNIKIERRKNMIYIQLIRQYKYMIKTNMRTLNNYEQTLDPEVALKHVHSLINNDILSHNQNIILNNLIVC